MFRELATVVVVVFVVGLYMIVAPAAIEPIADQAASGKVSDVNGVSTIASVEAFAFKWAPLFAIGGTILWALFRAFRKERRVGRVR